jgi:peptidyl-prolyl cis-trans isomerase SurA
MKKIKFFFLLLMPFQLNSQTLDLGGFGELVDDVVAIINDDVILRSELEPQIQAFRGNIDPNILINFSAQEIETEVLDQLISRRVQVQRAGQLGVFITDDDINQALNGIAAQNNISLTQIPMMLSENGIDYLVYRNELREQLIIQELMRRDVGPRIQVLPLELNSCMNDQLELIQSEVQFNVSHILLNRQSLGISSQDEFIEFAQNIIDRLNGGQSFESLAIEFSSAGTAESGGQIGWRSGNQLPVIFANQVRSLEIGETSEAIISNNDIHIVRLNAKEGQESAMVPQKLIRHILLTPTELEDNLVIQQRLSDIRDRILMGEDFGIVASAVSEDPLSAAEMGSLGWTSPGYLVPEFESQIADLSEAEVTPPFQSRFGWHIAEVIGNRMHDATNEMIELECDTQIRERKFEEQRLRWVTQLRDQAYIEILL